MNMSEQMLILAVAAILSVMEQEVNLTFVGMWACSGIPLAVGTHDKSNKGTLEY